MMTAFVCHGCGLQYADSPTPPDRCDVCTDDRQFVEWSGQAWTTIDELAATHSVRIETDGDLLGVGVTPNFAIPQRALRIETDAGVILWDCITVITPAAVEHLKRLGGIDMIVISHPHFYSAMVAWSDAFGGIPILLHEADRNWVRRSSPNIRYWSGDRHRLSDTVTLYHCPGHFPGSSLLHWTAAPNGRKVVLAGDTLHVTQDRQHVSFMYSVPNYLPLRGDVVKGIRDRIAGLDFDDVYGFTWGLNVLGDARQIVDRSIHRHLTAVTA
jgi:hypothetical protein